MGFLANSVSVWITGSIGVILLVITLWFLFSSESNSTRRIFAIITGIFTLIFGLAWYYGTTHRVVPLNKRWVIVNTATGAVDGMVRKSGVTTKPFLMYSIKDYPGVNKQPFCLDYTPALQEGYEITAHVCGTYDAGSLNWSALYQEFNFGDESAMLAYWADQSKELISEALKTVNYTMIVTDRALVSQSIRTNLVPWFENFGISVSNIQLTNWDFTSAKVRAEVDAASAASMRKTVETQLLKAAIIARERQLYEVETANLVLDERGRGLEVLFTSLNIIDDSAKAYLASQMTWFAYAQNPPDDVNVILGLGGNVPIASPITVQSSTSTPITSTVTK